MKTRATILRTLASAALICAGPALAQHGGGHGQGAGAPAGAGGMGNPGGMSGMHGGGAGAGNAGGMSGGLSDIGAQTREQARVNSQGSLHASPTGIAHANPNSVLAGTSGGTTLTGITTGMALMQNGTQVGAVTRVVTNNHGVIVRVLVQGTNGRIYSLSPNSLSLTGGTLTTTAMLRGI